MRMGRGECSVWSGIEVEEAKVECGERGWLGGLVFVVFRRGVSTLLVLVPGGFNCGERLR